MTTATPGVVLLTKLLKEDPSDFDICVLREDADDKDGASYYPQVVLQDGHLAIHAGDLPRLAKEFRKAYWMERGNLEKTACLLLVCPDHATAWADRKRLLLQRKDELLLWQRELAFVNLVMTRHSKAPNSWIHRKWLVRLLFAKQQQQQQQSKEMMVQKEIQHCAWVAERFPKNYYAWTHRMFVVDLFLLFQNNNETSLLQTEWETVEPWLRRHVSDHSAAHYGGHVLRLWCRRVLLSDSSYSREAALSIVQDALESARRLVGMYPTHETMWIYRRVCGHAVLEVVEGMKDNSLLCQQAMDRFLELEIVMLLLKTTKESNVSGERHLEWEFTQRHGLSYIIWILEQTKRCHCAHWIPQDVWAQVCDEVLALLAEQKCSHNIWRQPVLFARLPVDLKPQL